uniref:Uncharacterized protein n=1 Tax=Glossina austeni TaxID=7395 RepID=A0A1A9V5Q8_GLOAU
MKYRTTVKHHKLECKTIIHRSHMLELHAKAESLCNKNINTNTCHIKTGCEHFFHNNCFVKHIENNSNFPQCDVALTSDPGINNPNRQMITRQQRRNHNADLQSGVLQSEQTINVGITDDEENRINRLVTAAVTTQQTRLLSELTQQMTTLIQSSIETTFRNFNAQDPSVSTPTFKTSHNHTHLPPVQGKSSLRGLRHLYHTEKLNANDTLVKKSVNGAEAENDGSGHNDNENVGFLFDKRNENNKIHLDGFQTRHANCFVSQGKMRMEANKKVDNKALESVDDIQALKSKC